MEVLVQQLEELRDRFPAISTRALPSGTTVVTVQDVVLPDGWSKTRTEVRFLVPVAYPYTALDCFWTEGDLRLRDGRMPMNSNLENPIPEDGGHGLWFSWHLHEPWNPNRDSLSTWMHIVMARLRQLQ
ncbi:E2/UBC family protein [Rhizobium leguminosarum]